MLRAIRDSAGTILLSLILCLVWLRSSAFVRLPLHLLLLSLVWFQLASHGTGDPEGNAIFSHFLFNNLPTSSPIKISPDAIFFFLKKYIF
ncbi:hypothetical protein SETIT_2G444200v2 [Setaria italica]|uniref:Uncharacterized protein n=1 Tax=Setaria italica TaxID=4555 RepID=A0A368Q9J8_SETIT|nr:hypothetical protein SETIT_2G444200v2 [Setaria italica]